MMYDILRKFSFFRRKENDKCAKIVGKENVPFWAKFYNENKEELDYLELVLTDYEKMSLFDFMRACNDEMRYISQKKKEELERAEKKEFDLLRKNARIKAF